MQINESDILRTALETLYSNFPEIQIHTSNIGKNPHLWDGKLEFQYKSEKKEFFVEVKRNITSKNILDFVIKTKSNLKDSDQLLVVTEHMTKPNAYTLKSQDINFLDTVGNTYIKTDNFLLFVFDKTRVPKSVASYPKRAFYPTGLKLIFHLLLNPDFVNKNYRFLSSISGISHGSVGWVFHHLKDEEFIVNVGTQKRKLMNKKKLFEKWMDGYSEKLRPKILKGKYRFAKGELEKKWQSISLDNFPNTFWGGEVAAEIVTEYIKAGRITIYTADDVLELIKTLKLIPDDNGQIEILEVFWDVEQLEQTLQLSKKIVPIPLVYADLVSSKNDRNLEGAKLLYEQYLSPLF